MPYIFLVIEFTIMEIYIFLHTSRFKDIVFIYTRDNGMHQSFSMDIN